MLVMVGETRSFRNLATLAAHRWGRMFVVCRPTPYPFERWGFDNGAFVAWCKGRPFPTEDFRRRLDEALQVPSDPYLAVTPDIVAGGLHSLDFSVDWRTKLPGQWPWYLAVQDGMSAEDVRPVLHLFAGIFLGGSDRFKGTAVRWCKLAHSFGLKFHYGRAGTPDKLKHAYMCGADSCDSAFPLWSIDRMRQFVAHYGGLKAQHTLETTWA